MPPLLTNSKASCRSEKLTGIVPPQEYLDDNVERAPPCQWYRPEQRPHCRHNVRPEMFWAGLIDRLAGGQTGALAEWRKPTRSEVEARRERDGSALSKNSRGANSEPMARHRNWCGENRGPGEESQEIAGRFGNC